jgi:hypothetical protein
MWMHEFANAVAASIKAFEVVLALPLLTIRKRSQRPWPIRNDHSRV